MHRLGEIQIENFRSCAHCTVPLFELTPIVGQNNAGKSNILEAIKWVLKRRSLGESEFCDPGAPVRVSASIVGITEGVLDRVVGRHRERVLPLLRDGKLRVRRTQETPGLTATRIKLEVFNPHVDVNDWVDNPGGIEEAISALFPEPIHIGAMENAAEDVAKFKAGTTIGKLIAELTGPIEAQHGGKIAEALQAVRDLVEAEGAERAPEFVEFDEGANEMLNGIFPGVRVAVHVPAPELKEIFKAGTIRVYEGDGPAREVTSMGHGVQRSIQMALIRFLAKQKDGSPDGATTTMLLIDEPELYLHPQAVEAIRTSLEQLSKTAYQVVFTTHSAQMVGAGRAKNTLVVRKSDEKGTVVLPTLRDAITQTLGDAPHQAGVIFSLQHASDVLFADRVVLMEGKTEKRLLPVIYEEIRSETPFEGLTAFVPIGDSGGLPKARKILEALGVPHFTVTDLDFAFRVATRAKILPDDHVALAACRAILTQLQAADELALDAGGLPSKSNGASAEQGFAKLAQHPDAREAIAQLHAELLDQGIWIWNRGSIEQHLGLDGKKEPHWADFEERLYRDGFRVAVDDPEGVIAMFNAAMNSTFSAEEALT